LRRVEDVDESVGAGGEKQSWMRGVQLQRGHRVGV
jgi:hypothetical protein